MRLAWLTDIHLNFADDRGIDDLIIEIRSASPDVVLIAGDIGEAGSVFKYLKLLASEIELPIYFVLGNHDYYRGSIAEVRAQAIELSRQSSNLTWLPATNVVSLTEKTALIGHDGWGDGGYGQVSDLSPMLNDFIMIKELDVTEGERMRVLRELGQEAAVHVRSVLLSALENHEHTLVLTHVPPFSEAVRYNGARSNEHWLPYFGCRAVGFVLHRVMSEYLEHRLTVLCGHTHDECECQILHNLTVSTGGAEYGIPKVQQIIEVA